MIDRFLNSLLLSIFVVTSVLPSASYAQAIVLPAENSLKSLSPAFTPAQIKGMVINPKDPFKFDLIINPGDAALSDAEKKQEYTRLAKYFLASLTIPDTDQWVNLSPYEHNRIIADNFGKTVMGRDLLEQDQLLKQITSSLSNPDSALGKKFWNQVYEQAHQKFGDTIPTDVFNKVWVTPDAVQLYEKDNTVYVLSQHLKVQIAQDYAAEHQARGKDIAAPLDHSAELTQNIMRDVIIPALDKEVNTGKSFAQLRQIYSGMLLAAWYKQALKESLLTQVYGDQSKVRGVNQDPKNNAAIYAHYMEAFKRGAYNIIREDVDQFSTEVIPHKYFSGGMDNAQQAIVNARNKTVSVLRLEDSQLFNTSDLVRVNLMPLNAVPLTVNDYSHLLDKYKAAKFTELKIDTESKKQYKTYIGKGRKIKNDFLVTNVTKVVGGVVINVSYRNSLFIKSNFYAMGFDSDFNTFRKRIARDFAQKPDASISQRVTSQFSPEEVVANPYGGIDLARSNLDMQIERDGNGVPLPIAQQDLDHLRVAGFVPVVMNIRPASSLLITVQH